MENFYKKVKRNRKKLKEAGFSAANISRWEHKNRMPGFDNAMKLAQILNMDVQEIPYRHLIVNKPSNS